MSWILCQLISHLTFSSAPHLPNATFKSEFMVLNAYASTVQGDLTYTWYMATKALHDGIGLLEQGHTPPKKPWNGVETTTGTQQGWTLNNKLESLHPGDTIPVSKALSDPSAAFASSSLVSDDFNAETVIHGILDPILANTGPGLVLNPKSSVDTTLNDSTIVSGASTTKLGVAGQVVGGTPTFISFQISEFPGGLEDALSGLQQRFNAFTLPTAWVNDKKINIKRTSTTSDNGIHDSRAMVFGTYHLDLFLYKNLVVQIAGNSNSTSNALLDWTKAMWAELIKY